MSATQAAIDLWETWAEVAGLWWSRHSGVAPGSDPDARLQTLVAFARHASPFYRHLYAHLPEGRVELRDLPVVDKATLMKSFNAWSTDRRVRKSEVLRFLSRESVGETYLGRYHVWKSSGTSGTPGIFLQDAQAMTVYEALVLTQLEATAFDALGTQRFIAGAGRSALVAATGDHFASVTSWMHLSRTHPVADTRVFSVLEPTARLVEDLNAFQPSFLASYPSVLSLLAAEQRAGRLRIAPSLVWSGGEFLGARVQSSIENAFGCRVMNEYGASECLSIAFGCREGWLHVNREWVIVEGVDARGRPVEPGELSHTTLVTNLANRVQPVIRYDLGDRIIASPGRCACGNPLPAIRVEGRRDATLEVRGVRLPPLALSTVVEEAAGEHRFQITQSAADRLRVRFDSEGGAAQRERIGRLACRALERYLASQSVEGVRVEIDPHPPRVDPRSGKLHAVTREMASGA